ncbi:unnamed protein product [Phaedon cochleariae]|uniref:E3 ubiquitin-protein ligase APD1-4 middle domain-containing protein n=1 Tax=Phaedon cochleariae TaxID=80249 RepID=A0A9P0GUI3_PHACE|nr:unnamed protein product [Phaedon cochleariae]
MVVNLDFEEFPLQKSNRSGKSAKTLPFKVPSKVARLCILGIFFPCLLLSVPLYLRYRVYGAQLYPLAMSDMRLLDSRISTTWCQRQKVKVNATFNAFLLSSVPKLATETKQLSMTRELYLEDDTKEYWGFYLLKGTNVTVSTCVRWPGASLILIRGHKHLHECAYIGDDSSEELEELMEAAREKAGDPETNSSQPQQQANDPDLMKWHRPEVQFHSPVHLNNSRSLGQDAHNGVADDAETDPKAMKPILEALRHKYKQSKPLNAEHTHRNSTVAKEEEENMHIEKPREATEPEKVLTDILGKLKRLGDQGPEVLHKLNEQFKKNHSDSEGAFDTKSRTYSKPAVDFDEYVDQARRRKRDLILATALGGNQDDKENDMGIEEAFVVDGIADHRGTINETTLNDMSNSEFWSSFSSSEEALLNCAGLILSLPLMPHSQCLQNVSAEESYVDNSITYRVPTNGYYFFVFNSENEVVTNYIRVNFNIEKTVYDISNPVARCINDSECALNLDFFSSEKLVMELPLNRNDSLHNEEFIVISECEPRTALYAVFVILIPILIVTFAL